MTAEKIKAARKIFKNYSRMNMEIKQLDESIECAKKNREASINSDIYSASVSHSSGGLPGENSSADKIPRIAESIDKLRNDYDTEIYNMERRKNLLKRAVNSVEIFTSSLDWTDKTLLTRRYINDNKKSFDEISSEIHSTADALKKRERNLMAQYIKTAHIDIAFVETIL